MALTIQIVVMLVIGEVIIHSLFFLISKLIRKPNKDKINLVSVVKGLIERAFIVLCFSFDFTSSLAMLGALKIATRIKDEDKVSNDFFLIGNLVSVMFGITYYIVWLKIVE